MRKLAGFAVMAFGLALLALPAPAAADHHFATGDLDARINLLANCELGTIDYPANTAFYVAHGLYEVPWHDAAMEVKRAFVSPATTFELWIDGVLQPSAMHARYFSQDDIYSRLWVTEDHRGMTGTHVFVGLWFIDGSYPGVGGELGEPVIFGACGIIVNFV